MVGSIRLYAGLAVLSVLLVVVGVLGVRGGGSSEAPPPTPTEPASPEVAETQPQGPTETSQPTPTATAQPTPTEAPSPTPTELSEEASRSPVGLIAYVDLFAQIRTITPDGLDDRLVSSRQGVFTSPTWSPDARSLLFSGLVRDAAGNPRLTLSAFDLATGRTRQIYVNDPGIVGFVDEAFIHYPVWSPDSAQVAFIAVTSGGLTMLLHDLGQDTDAEFVLGDGPLWMSWSPDSQYVLAHRGFEHFLIDTVNGTLTDLNFQSLGYRVPGWSPRMNVITIAAADRSDGVTLYEANVASGRLAERQPLIRVGADVAFRWSPDGETLAIAESSRFLTYQDTFLRIFQELTLFKQDSEEEPTVIGQNVLAYFWSPDGKKLAYVTLSESQGVLRWMVVDTATGERWPLVDFVPSRVQLMVFGFFDQLANSHSQWSPDGGSLVFSGALRNGAVPASFGRSQAQTSHILVVDTGRNPTVSNIADGVVGYWSPR